MNPKHSVWNKAVDRHSGKTHKGTCGFRLMPFDEFEWRPATIEISEAAGGWATHVEYTWSHPSDGKQHGIILIASPGVDDLVDATLIDSWHQKPGAMHFKGQRTGDKLRLEATYMQTWGWIIEFDLSGDAPRMLMSNVIPPEATSMAPVGVEVKPGPYVVMDLQIQ